jgi:integrase
MKLVYRLSKKARKISEHITVYEVMARWHTGSIDQYAKTGVFVPVSFTDNNGNKKTTWAKGFVVVPKLSYADDEQAKLRNLLMEAKNRLTEIDNAVGMAADKLMMEKAAPPKGWLQATINNCIGTTATADETANGKGKPLLEAYNYYLTSDKLTISEGSLKHHRVILRTLERYEEAKGKVYLDDMTADTLHDLAKFIKNEEPEKRSDNYIATLMHKFRTFIRWANGLSRSWPIEPLTRNNPFERYAISSEQYGTPYYLTIEERNKLFEAQLPPRLARQRDIFVFQCLIGCRIGDLWAMTKDNIIDGAVEYIPRKTIEDRPLTVRVPLNRQAQAIIERYKDNGDTRLFPFVAQQQYNEDIKEMLKLAGITRIVTILDPLTRQEVKKPINEVASSHMARRTFIGNLYKQVKDPNLVGKLSGHVEGSKAFARYRDIDEDMAKELVSLLE